MLTFKIFLLVLSEIYINVKLPQLVKNIDKDQHGSFDQLMFLKKLSNTNLGIIIILSWFKLIKFFTLFSAINVICNAIYKSKLSLFSLSVVALLLLCGFAIAGHVLFRMHIQDFSTVGNSFLTLLALPMGGFHFFEETNYNYPVLAPIFQCLFIYTFILIIFSLFIAILVDGFERAENQQLLMGKKPKYGILHHLIYFTMKILIICKLYDLADKLQNFAKRRRSKKQYEMLLAILIRHGLRGQELTLFMDKHKISENEEFSYPQLMNIYLDLEAKDLLKKDADLNEQLSEERNKLLRQLDSLEKAVTEIFSKIDNSSVLVTTTEDKKSI